MLGRCSWVPVPPADNHFFARLLAEDDDQSVYAQVHAAHPDAPPFQVRTWRQANPALDSGLPRGGSAAS